MCMNWLFTRLWNMYQPGARKRGFNRTERMGKFPVSQTDIWVPNANGEHHIYFIGMRVSSARSELKSTQPQQQPVSFYLLPHWGNFIMFSNHLCSITTNCHCIQMVTEAQVTSATWNPLHVNAMAIIGGFLLLS